jgi:hypothetical protein
MKFIAEWKNVEKDGLPLPDDNKTYVVLYDWGTGFGSYEYERDEIKLDKPDIYGRTYDYIKSNRGVWRLDFDAIGHEDTITNYFEIIYPWDCEKEDLS